MDNTYIFSMQELLAEIKSDLHACTTSVKREA